MSDLSIGVVRGSPCRIGVAVGRSFSFFSWHQKARPLKYFTDRTPSIERLQTGLKSAMCLRHSQTGLLSSVCLNASGPICMSLSQRNNIQKPPDSPPLCNQHHC